MAYPSLIQKIYDMRQEVLDTQYVEAEQARQFVILADRLTKIELALIRGGIPTVSGSIHGGGVDADCLCTPEGYEMHKGTRVAPLTIVSKGSIPVPGAAITAVVSDMKPE